MSIATSAMLVSGHATATAATTTVPSRPVAQVAAGAKESVPSGLKALTDGPQRGLPTPAVALSLITSGGPPPDGIPPIDRPRFLAAGDVRFLADNEPVIAVEVGGEARAYPVQILIWHEIVNDTVGGIPVAVTYCPLCNSAAVFDRRLGTRTLSFGTSGSLLHSSLVMYDRQTESLWTHFDGAGIVGVLTGTRLRSYPAATVSWKTWRSAHRTGLVLSRETGTIRNYGKNPYPGYDNVNRDPFLFEGKVDGRYTAMTRVVGIQVGKEAYAVPLAALRKRRVLTVHTAGGDLVVVWVPGTASAVDADDVAAGFDVGSTGVFRAVLDAKPVTLRVARDLVVDVETKSRWDVLGRAVAGPLRGRHLERIAHVDTFWFAWSTFQPATTVVTS